MSSQDFTFRSRDYNIHFGEGSLDVLPELIGNDERVFTIVSERSRSQLSEVLMGKNVYFFTDIVQHVPQVLVTKASRAYRQEKSSLLLVMGGGSAIGLAKAIALETGDKIIAIPTTYAGSEMTNIWGITGKDGTKTTGRADVVMPRHVVYDTQLTLSMPKPLAVTSAFNALAHLVEAVYAPDGNPVTTSTALLGIKKLVSGLTALSKDERLTNSSNNDLTMGAFLAGKSLGEVSMSLHHKAAHVLGGNFKLEHSHVHTVLLPYVLHYQWPALSEAIKENFQQAFGASSPAQFIIELQKQANAPLTLQQIGFKEENIQLAAEQILAKPYANPREIKVDGLLGMLEMAFHGKLE